MSCQLTSGGQKSIFPLKNAQIERIRQLGLEFTLTLGAKDMGLEPRFGAVMKPDGVAFYLATYCPSSPGMSAWRGMFFADQGPYYIAGSVDADPNSGRVSTDMSVLEGRTPIVNVRWVVTGPAVGTEPTNIAGMLSELNIVNPGPHARECLRDCIALHAPQCVPMRQGNEPELVATVAAVAASCLINCRC
jgi:hypothetical protein